MMLCFRDGDEGDNEKVNEREDAYKLHSSFR